MQLGHYAIKANEEIEKHISFLKHSSGIKSLKPEHIPVLKKTVKSLTSLSNGLKEGVCWSINQDALPMVWHTDISNDSLEGIKLPYPTMVVEYDFDYEALGLTFNGGKQNLAFNQQNEYVEGRQRVLQLTEMTTTNGEEGFLVEIICRTDTEALNFNLFDPSEWGLGACSVFVPYERLGQVDQWFRRIGKQGFEINWGKGGIYGLPASSMIEAQMKPDDWEKARNEMGDDLRVLLGFLQVIACDNAPIEEIPPSAKLNKKRAKRGKPSIPTYRTLRDSARRRSGKRSGVTVVGGTKRSHWRRGHIRNQPTAKGYIKKWIRPCIVGADIPDKPEIVLT